MLRLGAISLFLEQSLFCRWPSRHYPQPINVRYVSSESPQVSGVQILIWLPSYSTCITELVTKKSVAFDFHPVGFIKTYLSSSRRAGLGGILYVSIVLCRCFPSIPGGKWKYKVCKEIVLFRKCDIVSPSCLFSSIIAEPTIFKFAPPRSLRKKCGIDSKCLSGRNVERNYPVFIMDLTGAMACRRLKDHLDVFKRDITSVKTLSRGRRLLKVGKPFVCLSSNLLIRKWRGWWVKVLPSLGDFLAYEHNYAHYGVVVWKEIGPSFNKQFCSLLTVNILALDFAHGELRGK